MASPFARSAHVLDRPTQCIRAFHRTHCRSPITHLHLHLQSVEDSVLRVAVLVALDDLDDLVARLRVEERATLTSATRSRLISPELSVFSPDTKSAPVGGSAFRPPGRTIVQSMPDARRAFSATSFSSR